jgi:hypothetical protein
MDANPGKHRSEMDLEELKASLHYGNPFAATASMLCRDEDEVRQIARQRRLTEYRASGASSSRRNRWPYRVISMITTCKITTTATPMAVNATAPRCSSRLTQSPPAWPHSPRSSGGNFVGRSPAFRIHIRFTVEGLKVISREASVTSRRRP